MVENLKTLSSVMWGKAALNLLSHSGNLIPNSPAVLIIRHSEREEPEKFKDIFMETRKISTITSGMELKF